MSERRRAVDVRGVSVTYREAGSGPVAIIASGLGLTGRFYDLNYATLAQAGIRIIVPDLPGYGATRGRRTGATPELHAAFLLDFAHTIEVRRAVWIGHSLGAQVVTHVAARRPDMAHGIVLSGPTGRPGRREIAHQAWGLAQEAKRTSFAVLRAVARDYIHTSPFSYVGTWLRHGNDDLLQRLARVQCPALVVVGDNDPVCRPDFIAMLRQRMPAARVVWVKGGTHALPRGHAAAFNRAVIDFVRDTTR